MSTLVITPHEAVGATLGVQVTATLIGYVDGERVPVTGIVTGTDRVIVRPTSVRITELPFTLDLEENASIAPSNTRWLIDVGGDEFVIVKGAGSETLEDALDEDLVELATPVLQQKVDDAVAAVTAAGVVAGPLGGLAFTPGSVTTPVLADAATSPAKIAGEVLGYRDPLKDLTGWTDAKSVLPAAYDQMGVVTGGVGVPNPSSGGIGLANQGAGHALIYKDLGITAPCSVKVQIDPRHWPAEGGPALFVDLTKNSGWFCGVMTRDLFPPDPPNPYFWLANGGKTNANITPHDLHAFTAEEIAKYLDASRPADPVWLEVRVAADWTATFWVDGIQIPDLSATVPVELRGSTSFGLYVDTNATDGNAGAGGTRPQNLPVIVGPFVASSLVPDATSDGVASGAEVSLQAGAALTRKGGKVDRLTITPPPRLYSYGNVAQPAFIVRHTDGTVDVVSVDDGAVTITGDLTVSGSIESTEGAGKAYMRDNGAGQASVGVEGTAGRPLASIGHLNLGGEVGALALDDAAGAAAPFTLVKAGDFTATLGGTSRITGSPDAVSSSDIVPLSQVQSLIASQLTTAFDFKASVRAATTANITLSGAQTIDGVSVVAGDRVLVKNQSSGATNGIYVAAAGAWSRATDADASAEVTSGMAVPVSEGTVNAGRLYMLTTADTITLGTTALTFTRVDAGDLAAANNLSDVASVPTARTNLGLSSTVTPHLSGVVPYTNVTQSKAVAIPNNSWTPMPFDTESVDIDAQWATPATTTIAAGSNGAALPQTTLNVVDASSFAASGFVAIDGPPGTNILTVVQYAGKTGTTLTGCTGGTGTLATGQTVRQVGSITFPKAGIYKVTADNYWASNGTGARATRLILSGILPTSSAHYPALTIAGQGCPTQALLHVTAATKASTTLGIQVFQTSGGTLNTSSSGLEVPRLQVAWVGPATDGI